MSVVVYGVDTSCSGHVAWCNCGWRSMLEDDVECAVEAMVLHRTRDHAEGRGRVERQLGLGTKHPRLEAIDEPKRPTSDRQKRKQKVSQAAIECGERIRHLAREMEAGRL